ncbi:hypothetical protein CALVIDRAFT_115804 [Calocera viscosa TUFC12733]|uniref:Uncharacterized protein n=1 Tax=Calocera viscosa (strain TUFC12733) TaxID=1330018 RepID=A0A167M7I8_CALVF|nr:hypothetical protein CALVIDRAFT_115804 [Calocera viscosa TUFC12733]
MRRSSTASRAASCDGTDEAAHQCRHKWHCINLMNPRALLQTYSWTIMPPSSPENTRRASSPPMSQSSLTTPEALCSAPGPNPYSTAGTVPKSTTDSVSRGRSPVEDGQFPISAYPAPDVRQRQQPWLSVVAGGAGEFG